MIKKGLGKGLGALIPGFDEDIGFDVPQASEGETQIKIIDIEPDKNQPRKSFDIGSLGQLAESIRLHGVIQPILVKALGNGRYSIIAGERRWRAARMAGLKTVPAVIRNSPESNVMELALIENLQREDLNPMEEAAGYKSLMDTYNWSQEQIGVRVGKSRSAIANIMRLLTLPSEIQEMVARGDLGEGHARALITIKDAEYQMELARNIAELGLSVREVERLAKSPPKAESAGDKSETSEHQGSERNFYTDRLAESMSRAFGTRVRISSGKNKSKIEIEYYNEGDLERIIKMIGCEDIEVIHV